MASAAPMGSLGPGAPPDGRAALARGTAMSRRWGIWTLAATVAGLAATGAGTTALPAAPAAPPAAAPAAPRQAGRTDGVWYWTLPSPPNGSVPKQGWSGAGEGPPGSREIYVGGMDHVANAALYLLRPGGGGPSQPGATLSYLGDARAAARAAGNLGAADRFEKFHTQPVFLNGRVYVGNMDYSDVDGGYTAVRGLHWFAYDRALARFQDLSKPEPGGVAAARLGVPGLAADRRRGLLYALATPTGELLRYDPAARVTTRLGRPAWGRPYLYPSRALWVGGTGRVYFTAGNPSPNPRAGGPYDPAAFNHVRYWDPATRRFGDEPAWTLHDTRALDFGRCFETAPRTCYLMDNVGHVYRYREAAGRPPSWTEVGDLGQPQGGLYGLTWVFQVRPGGGTAYVVARRGAVLAMDLASGRTTLLGNLWALEPALNGQDFYGNSAWDAAGRFYLAAFPKELTAPGRTKLVAIDPVRFAAAAAAAAVP